MMIGLQGIGGTDKTTTWIDVPRASSRSKRTRLAGQMIRPAALGSLIFRYLPVASRDEGFSPAKNSPATTNTPISDHNSGS